MDGSSVIGVLWFLAIVGGPVLLGIAFIYGAIQWRNRDRRLDPVRDAAVRRNYAEDERDTKATGGSNPDNVTTSGPARRPS